MAGEERGKFPSSKKYSQVLNYFLKLLRLEKTGSNVIRTLELTQAILTREKSKLHLFPQCWWTLTRRNPCETRSIKTTFILDFGEP